MTTPSATEVLGMSDEDFAKLNEPPASSDTTTAATETAATETTEAATETTQTEETVETAAATETSEAGETNETGGETTGSEESTESTGAEGQVEDKSTEQTSTETGDTTGSEAAESKNGEEKSEETAPNYEDFYNKVLATPLKANGKDIKLTSVDEVVKLMQQGANYTRKMQELAPARKVLMMLQNNELLDADRLSFLIDLEKGNPEAIKKLIKDKGIDVLDLDTQSEPAYTAGEHVVTDAEVGFRTVLDEVSSTDAGKQTLAVINTTWDEASKKKLWDSPEVMSVIHQQREIKAEGDKSIYDLITTEVERRTTLGLIPVGTPFIQAYTLVGNEMAHATLGPNGGQGGQTTEAGSGQGHQPTTTVLATRAATPKPTVSNGDKANAASPTRSSPKPAKTVVNPLAMSDEEFEKHSAILEGRV